MDKMFINSEMALKGKSKMVAFLLWLFLSAFGAHQFYMGDSNKGITQVILFWVGWLTSFLGIGIVMLLVWAIWVIVDLFLISGKVDQVNYDLKKRLILELERQKESEERYQNSIK